MSIFQGSIDELEHVSVDNFELSASNKRPNSDSSCFFLSHCHSDHMRGLREKSFITYMKENPSFRIYGSDISVLILRTFEELNPIYSQIKELKIGLSNVCVPPTTDSGVSYNITVSCIPAGHCPGSIMFLFETPLYTILYTGDFRLACGDVSKFKQLHNGETVKKIDKIYIDLTFFSKFYCEFLSRKDSIAIIIEESKAWLEKDPQNVVQLDMTANYGGEHIIKSIGKELQCRVHVHPIIFDLYERVPEIRNTFTDDCTSTRIHAQIRTRNEECLKSCPQWSKLVIKPVAAQFRCLTGNKPETHRMWGNTLAVNYSSHSSYSEILNFLQYLRPRDIHICTSTFNLTADEQREQIEQLLSSWSFEQPLHYPEAKRLKINERTDYKSVKIIVPNFSQNITDKDLDSFP